jgi:hypothetical protein
MRVFHRCVASRPPSEGARRTIEGDRTPIDTSTAAGKCLLDMLGVFAEFP